MAVHLLPQGVHGLVGDAYGFAQLGVGIAWFSLPHIGELAGVVLCRLPGLLHVRQDHEDVLQGYFPGAQGAGKAQCIACTAKPARHFGRSEGAAPAHRRGIGRDMPVRLGSENLGPGPERGAFNIGSIVAKLPDVADAVGIDLAKVAESYRMKSHTVS